MKSSEIKKAVILAHYAATGPTEELRDWLNRKHVREVLYIAFPFMNSESRAVMVSVFRHGKLVFSKSSRVRFKKPEPLSYIKDILYGLWYGIRYCRGADFAACGDNLLAFVGLCLTVTAGVKHVIYYMIDYTPVRYKNFILNALYYMLDRFAAYHAEVWAHNEKIIRRRFEDGKLDERRVQAWQEVPYGAHHTYAKQFNRHAVVYMGGLVFSKGAELFIPILEKLLERDKRYRMVLVGGGDYLHDLTDEIRQRGLSKYAVVHGYINDMHAVLDILSHCGVGIAPYFPEDKNSFTYNTDTGKLKVYIGCALPVVVTDVPPFARVLAEKKAGRISRYDAKDIAEQVHAIVKNHARYRKNARALSEQFSWEKIYTKAFEQLRNK